MGQEIAGLRFHAEDFARFQQRLGAETVRLAAVMGRGDFSHLGAVAGMELEAWLVDADLQPAPSNSEFLAHLASDLACPELAKFNVEFNTVPLPLQGGVLGELALQLSATLQRARSVAQAMGLHLVLIGILPTLEQHCLTLAQISPMNRYRALNEQILRQRGKPIHLDIAGHERLNLQHHDVMLESATTSYQLHLQAPLSEVHRLYNASIVASAFTVAAAANAPFLFGRDLWAETRIPLFEQAVETGGYRDAAAGPLRRVSFGSDYARHSLLECFQENLEHFPVLLPMVLDEPEERYAHLRLHNGVIWRWNRPLVGFDVDGTPHLRVEHRVMAAGPSVADMVGNAAFYYGLVHALVARDEECLLDFAQAKDNFYQAARHGLDAHVTWRDDRHQRLGHLLLHELLPLAEEGLAGLGVDAGEARHYLDIVGERCRSGQTGSAWQRLYAQRHGRDFAALTHAYLQNQLTNRPVHTWDLTST